MIKSVVLFETKGKQFPTLKKAIEHRENLIAQFVEKLPGFETISPKGRIKLMQAIIDNRKALIDLFDYNEELSEDDDDC